MFLMICKYLKFLVLLVIVFASSIVYASADIDLIVSGHNSNFSFSYKNKVISVSSSNIDKDIKINTCNRLQLMPNIFALKFKLSTIEKYITSEDFKNIDRYKFIFINYSSKKYKIPRNNPTAVFVASFPQSIYNSYLISDELCN